MTTQLHNPQPLPPLSPRDLAFPPKFSQWRPGQFESILQAVTAFESGKRFVAINLTTGGGKSGAGYGIHTLLSGRTLILTSTKELQQQYETDFGSCGMFDFRGRQNYDCLSYDNCANGRVSGCDHIGSRESAGDCPYVTARDRFLSSKLNVSNYACYFANNMYGEGVGNVDTLILDEAHNAVEELSSALTIVLDLGNFNTVSLRASLSEPPLNSTPMHWRDWAESCTTPIREVYDQVKSSGGQASWLRMIDTVLSTIKRIATLPDDWIIDETKAGEIAFAPLWPTDFAEKWLFRGVKRVVLMSATIVVKTTELLNIPASELAFISSPHSFNPRRSPVYLFGAARIDFRTTPSQWAETLGRIDTIIDRRLDRKGVIHPVSYDRVQTVIQGSNHRGLMIAPKGKALHDSLILFRASAPPRILITPAITTGYDFPGSACEYQIILKVPFIDTRSPIMKARSTADPEYVPYLVAQVLTQTCGRGMRSEKDQCENFIMDKHANWFFMPKGRNGRRGGYQHLFPAWFIAQVQYPDSFPAPPPPLGNQPI